MRKSSRQAKQIKGNRINGAGGAGHQNPFAKTANLKKENKSSGISWHQAGQLPTRNTTDLPPAHRLITRIVCVCVYLCVCVCVWMRVWV